MADYEEIRLAHWIDFYTKRAKRTRSAKTRELETERVARFKQKLVEYKLKKLLGIVDE